jgi:hypothetical protein
MPSHQRKSATVAARAVTPQEALAEAARASQFLQGLQLNPLEALRIIEPYACCAEFTDAAEEQTRRIRSIICSVVADCHRELGDVNLAAKCYREASEYWMFGGYAPFYADMVTAHELAEHYEEALECLRFNQASWQQRPLSVRLWSHLVSRWWLYPSQWRVQFRKRRRIPRLEALIKEMREIR